MAAKVIDQYGAHLNLGMADIIDFRQLKVRGIREWVEGDSFLAQLKF